MNVAHLIVTSGCCKKLKYKWYKNILIKTHKRFQHNRPSNSHEFRVRHAHLRSFTRSHVSLRHSHAFFKKTFSKIKKTQMFFSVCTHNVISAVLRLPPYPSLETMVSDLDSSSKWLIYGPTGWALRFWWKTPQNNQFYIVHSFG